MRNELNQIELIEGYLLGTLAPAELTSFENRLKNEPELARDVALQQQLTKRFHRGMMVAALNQAHGQWTGANGGAGGSGSSFLGGIGTWITIGALAMVSLSTWWFLKNQESSTAHPQSETSLMYLDSLDDTARHFQTVTDTSTFRTAPVSEVKTELEIEEDYSGQHNEEVLIESFEPDSHNIAKRTSNSFGQNSSLESLVDKEAPEFDLPDNGTSTSTEVEEKLIDMDPLQARLLQEPLAASLNAPNTMVAAAACSPDFDTFFIDPSLKQKLNFNGGQAIITVPANVLVDAQGNLVQDQVTILFRDFRTPGDMVTEAIPMHWLKGKDHMEFNSAGMYEIRAYSADGQEVFMNSSLKGQPSLTIQYEIDETVDSLGFYYLNEKTNRWEYLDEVAEQVGEVAGQANDRILEEAPDSVRKRSRLVSFNGRPINSKTRRKGFWGRLLEFFRRGTINGETGKGFKDVFTTPKWVIETGNRTLPTSSPLAVQEHNIRQFGYHNYDQLLKMPNRITLMIRPIDSTGNRIEQVGRYVVVEHKTNAAFHYYQNKIFMHPAKKYDIILLSDSGSMFYCSYNDLKQITNKKSGQYTVEFTDITNMIKEPRDFDALFHISRRKQKAKARLN